MHATAAMRPPARLDRDHLADFRDQGFCELQGWVPRAACQALIAAYTQEVKPFDRPLLRQRSAAYETHRYTSQGFMENALLDVHRQDLFDFASFPRVASQVLGQPDLLSLVTDLLGAAPLLVQSMYFESSKGTPEHFDVHFLGTDEALPMLGVWVALEDIDPCDGRFFVYPGSHDPAFLGHPGAPALQALRTQYAEQARVAIHGHQDQTDRSQLHAVMTSKRSLRQLIDQAGWHRHHPRLRAGDVIVFSAELLHGSEVPSHVHASRHSLTGHFVTLNQRHIRYGQVCEPIVPTQTQGLPMHWSLRHRYINIQGQSPQSEAAWTA